MPSVRAYSSTAWNGSASSIAKPSGTQTGDVMILFHAADNGDTSTMSVSGDWTVVASRPGIEGGWGATMVWRRTATASEPSSWTVGQHPSADGVAVVLTLQDASAAGIVAESAGGEAFTQYVYAPAATPSTADCLDIRLGGGTIYQPGAAVTWGYPAGFTPVVQRQSRVYASGAVAYTARTGNAPVGQAAFQVSPFLDFSHGFTVLVPPAAEVTPPPPAAPPPTIPALASTEQVVHYTYVFADLLTDELVAKDLDLANVSYDRRIGEGAQFSADCYITDAITAAKVARVVPRHPEDLSTGPGRTVCHVYRNGVVWGSYVIWSASVSRSGRDQPITVHLSGTSLESYLGRVKIRSDLVYEGTDQIQIARNLLDAMQSTPRYDIGLVLQDGLSGTSRHATYLAADSRTYGEELAELANQAGGFEWAIVVVDEDGVRTRYWTWGFPTLGSATTTHKFLEPGNVLSWQEDIAADRGGTAFQVRGKNASEDASEDAAAPVSPVVLAQAHLDAGWPGLDVTSDVSTESDVTVLDGYATWQATHLAGAVRVHQVTVRLPANSSFGPGNLGDTVTVMLSNPWWPIEDGVASFVKSWRVVGMAFKPPAKGSGQEECTLTFEETMGEG